MKCMTISAVLDQKLVTADTKIFCEKGTWMHRGRPLRDHHGYGDLSVADILKKSSNIGTAKLAVMLGNQRLHNYLSAFGFGTRLGVGLPGEEAGILHAPHKWSGISSSRIAIGQGVAVTPLQMLNAVCAIANGGKLMRPYVIRKVVAKDGTILKERRPECIGTPISEDTAETMRHLMARVTDKGGTGTRARIPGFTTAGKTGTAQKPVAGRYSDTLFFASYVGFVPAERPEVGIIVVVDEPRPTHTGGAVSAPAFSAIADGIVRYFDIKPPDKAFELAYKR
jgi:cell division protein FtsI (penicillin-binding protein 3)